MDARLQRRVQRYGWDKAACHYERSWQHQLEPAQTALLDMACLCPGERALDVACGTGLVTLRAAALVGPNGTAIGTDLSEQMVATARDGQGAIVTADDRILDYAARTSAVRVHDARA